MPRRTSVVWHGSRRETMHSLRLGNPGLVVACRPTALNAVAAYTRAKWNGPTTGRRSAITVAAHSRPRPEFQGADLPGGLTAYLGQRVPQVVSEWPSHPAAVLVPLHQETGEWKVLFTRRTDSVDAHPGQVSFPGGRLEPTDRDSRGAALREAEEEIGLLPEDVSILGVLDSLLTVTQFLVTPVVASIPWPYRLTLNPHEVASAFSVPVDWLADPAHVEARERPGPSLGRTPIVYYFRPLEGEVIWGVTARITLQLIEALRQSFS